MNELFCETENGVVVLDSFDLLRLLVHIALATASNACVKSFFQDEGERAAICFDKVEACAYYLDLMTAYYENRLIVSQVMKNASKNLHNLVCIDRNLLFKKVV